MEGQLALSLDVLSDSLSSTKSEALNENLEEEEDYPRSKNCECNNIICCCDDSQVSLQEEQEELQSQSLLK